MQLRLPSRRSAVPEARHWAAETARGFGLDRDVVAVVELATSELVANAVLHAAGPEIEVRTSLLDGQLIVAVTDASDDLPVLRTTGPEVPGGQGMRLVQRLATRWGADRHHPHGKTVWAGIVAERT